MCTQETKENEVETKKEKHTHHQHPKICMQPQQPWQLLLHPTYCYYYYCLRRRCYCLRQFQKELCLLCDDN
jgi:hypothetical protein